MADDEDFPLSSSDFEEEDEGEDCSAINMMFSKRPFSQGLEDGTEDDCHWSISSVITEESLLAAQKEDLRKVIELLVISEQHARTLLIHYRWDVERIFELLEQKGKERLFSEAGVTIIENRGIDLSSSSTMHTCNLFWGCFS